MKENLKLCLVVVLLSAALIPIESSAQQKEDRPSQITMERETTLVKAVMCEEINGQIPQEEAVVFSVKLGKVLCFSSFDPVYRQTSIYHKWFFRDKPNSGFQLTLKPPRWATFSQIHLRSSDKGPWRIEIVDQEGKTLDVLRFSIVD